MESIQQFFVFVLCMGAVCESYARIGFTGDDMNAALATDSPPFAPDMDNCREACQQKYSLDTVTCVQAPVCMQCLDTCRTISNEQTLASNQWTVRVASMIKQEFLVATHLAWEPSNELIKCLISWDVFGGGLMGNLLTDSSNVELSLWPDTKYRVQVTCKNKRTGATMKSYPLTVDTTEAIEMKPQSSSETVSSTSAPNVDTPVIDISTMDPFDSEWPDDYNEIPFEYRQRVFDNKYDPRVKEIVLGAVAAIIMFLLIVTMMCASRRDPLDLKMVHNLATSSDSQDANELLNEIVCLSNNNNNFNNNNNSESNRSNSGSSSS